MTRESLRQIIIDWLEGQKLARVWVEEFDPKDDWTHLAVDGRLNFAELEDRILAAVDQEALEVREESGFTQSAADYANRHSEQK